LRPRFAKGIELDRLARAADISAFHFSRQFKKATGFSPSQYFIRMRMAKARGPLRSTSSSHHERLLIWALSAELAGVNAS
jgi:AraC family transcriptional regulator